MKAMAKRIITFYLTLCSKKILRRFSPKIVMITGSVGKTSTKDAVYTAMSSICSARKSEKSFNSEIGVPLTILDLPNGGNSFFAWLGIIIGATLRVIFTFDYPDWLVLEVGADKPGDLSELLSWIKPNMVVVTRFPAIPPHAEFYQSAEDVIREESLPAMALSSSGTLILNDDDERVVSLAKDFPGKVITYGLTPRAKVMSEGDKINYKEITGKNVPSGVTFNIIYEDNIVPFSIKDAIGVSHIYPVLAGVAAALSEGGDISKISRSFLEHETPLGRMHILEGIKNTIIIDDSYNSSPTAVEIALETFSRLEVSGRRIVALGDMRELGTYAKNAHYEIGKLIPKFAEILITVGILSRGFVEGALDSEMDESNIFQFDSSKEAGKFLEGIIKEGDTILVKGSQNTIRMEWLIEEIMLHPENKEKLLVRQGKEWEK